VKQDPEQHVKSRLTRRELLRVTLAAVAAPAAFAQAPLGRGAKAGERRVVEGISFAWCPPGRFRMGSPPDEPGRRGDEAQVDVTLTRGFWIARTETTQGEWQRIAGPFPDQPPTENFGLGETFPAYWINFAEAEQFCARLTERARRAGALTNAWACRLPTEAQWEYACRAGTDTAFAFGAALTPDRANFNAKAVPGVRGSATDGRATPAARYPANAWGISDMHGNIFEWCRDWYHAQLPGGVDPDIYTTRGQPNGDGSYSRVRRGGAWNDPAVFCRSALRLRYEPERRSDHIGFRVVIVEV
jgi:formylglycine-generating enzyme required for sulfatase activity